LIGARVFDVLQGVMMRSRAITVAAVLSGALVAGGWLVRGAGDGPRLAGPGGLSGLLFGTRRAETAVNGRRLLDEVMARVSADYVDTVGTAALYRKAVDGLLFELRDPHSVYLPPDRFAALSERTSGSYGGLGIEINARESGIEIITPLASSPAERAGIQAGDRIVAVDGRPTRGLSLEEASKLLRGRAGSAVTLTVARAGVSARLPFRLVREEIRMSPVQNASLLRPGLGYVDVSVFADSAAAELSAAIGDLQRKGMTTLVIDLRGNPGGLLDEGVAVADLFLDPGKEVVRTRGRAADANRTWNDRAPQRWPDLPVVVLVDGASASASEIVAGALQDHDRAVILGATSYGKGSAQTLLPMPEGGALKLTTALWYTPSGRSINHPRPTDDDAADEGEDEATPQDSAERRPTFRTAGGRTVYGGGGITPDVVAGDTAAPKAELALQQALGRDVPRFRDLVTDYAVSLRPAARAAGQPFTATPAMRDELYRRAEAAKLRIRRAVYDSAAQVVDRTLTYEVTRLAFGPAAEFARRSQDDPVIAAALSLTAGTVTRQELARRADARAATARADSAAR
jgi:carboxyl-terminal processing protease